MSAIPPKTALEDGLQEAYDRVRQKLSLLSPGVIVVTTIAAAASFLSEHYRAPVMLFALLIGMAFHFLSSDGRCAPGIEFASKRLLRIGVALLGARITIGDVLTLGAEPMLLVLGCVVATIGVGILLGRIVKDDTSFGLLSGGAVAICGASAALAISSVLPKTSADDERKTLFTVVAVTSLSTVAMIVYPIVFKALGFDEVHSGILIGATIHDVAQVVGAGYAISDAAGNTATYVKLVRVALLPIVVIMIALTLNRSRVAGQARWPFFALGFFVMLAGNSAGLIPALARSVLVDVSSWLLVIAIAALGMKTSLQAMFTVGTGYLSVVVAETLFLALLATALLKLM